MITDLPSTSVGAVSKKILQLRGDVGAMALSRVLTLVISVGEEHGDQALQVATAATRQHPSRIVCVVEGNRRGKARMDAQLRLGGEAGASEMVVMRLYGELTRHGAAVVLPFLLADSPVVTWWPYRTPRVVAEHPLGRIAQRRITDAEHAADPCRAIAGRAKTYVDGDTDLVWTRTTTWRGILAAVVDQPPFEPVQAVTVTGAADSAASDLLAAWLASSLQCPLTRAASAPGTGITGVRLERASGPIDLIRPDGSNATLEQPGQPRRRLALLRREDAECLADELARLDADHVYRRTLLDGLPRLSGRGPGTVAGETRPAQGTDAKGSP